MSNQITLRIANVPSFLSPEHFDQVFRGMAGCTSTKLNRQGPTSVGMAVFQDLVSAQRCKNMYHGWTGWGTPGLDIQLDTRPADTAGYAYDPEQYAKQQQQRSPNTGVYGQQQQPQQAQTTAAPAATVPATAAAAAGGAGASPNLAAALAGLTQSQLTNLAGLLGAAVSTTGPKPAAAPGQVQGSAQLPATTTQPTTGTLGTLAPAGGLTAAPQPLATALQQTALSAAAGQSTMAAAQAAMQPLLGMLTAGQLIGAPAAGTAAQPGAVNLSQIQALLQLSQAAAQPRPAATLPAAAPQLALPQSQQQPQTGGQYQPQAGGQYPPPQAGPPGAGQGPPPDDSQVALPPNATHTLFFDTLPLDLTKREAAHIFRPIQGFKELRLLVKEHPHRPGDRSTKLFVDFTDAHAATVAMNLLQGYKLDMDDDASAVLKPMYGRPNPAVVKAQAAAERASGGYGRAGPADGRRSGFDEPPRDARGPPAQGHPPHLGPPGHPASQPYDDGRGGPPPHGNHLQPPIDYRAPPARGPGPAPGPYQDPGHPPAGYGAGPPAGGHDPRGGPGMLDSPRHPAGRLPDWYATQQGGPAPAAGGGGPGYGAPHLAHHPGGPPPGQGGVPPGYAASGGGVPDPRWQGGPGAPGDRRPGPEYGGGARRGPDDRMGRDREREHDRWQDRDRERERDRGRDDGGRGGRQRSRWS